MLFALHLILTVWLTPTTTGPVIGVDPIILAPRDKVGFPGEASHVAEE